MTPQEISQIAIESAKTYRQYLADQDRGWSAIELNEIRHTRGEEGVYTLVVAGKLFDVEAVVFRYLPDGKDYAPNEIKILEYNADKNTLKVRPKGAIRHVFDRGARGDLIIISDLKFLVTRVQDWFEVNGESIKFPSKASCLKDTINELEVFDHLPPSKDQESALRNIFTQPFTYVWGAPGTGKTQFVLAYSVLHYLRAGKRVAIFAPTNNAIEQVLRGVIKMTDMAGIIRTKIFRMGIPSGGFVKDFPDICEAQGLQKKIKGVEKEVSAIQGVLTENSLRYCLNSLKKALPVLEEAAKEHNRISVFEEERVELKEQEKKFKKQEKKLELQVEKAKALLDPDEAKTSKRSQKARGLENKLSLLVSDLKEIRKRLKNEKPPEPDFEKIEQSIDQFHRETLDLSELAAILENLTPENPGDIYDQLLSWKVKAEDELMRIKPELASYRLTDESVLRFRLETLQGELEALREKSSDGRIEEAQIIAGTLDTFIGRYPNKKLAVDHFFLDEAGYASLIKALTLFREGIPVTLLGDHQQLPPVCEMNDREIKEKKEFQDVFLWSQAALHMESLFNGTRQEALDVYFTPQVPSFQTLVKSDLRSTHRFGKELAEVLDLYVYKNGFQSAYQDVSTEIWVAHVASAKTETRDRKNEAEIDAIQVVISALDTDDFVILTPYNLQRKVIGERFPQYRRKQKILTVHGSQGREWDTVILSVVDTHRKWFTDSKNRISRGLNVINTAVSRAKRKLILVCDGNFWYFENGQLLQGLVRIGKPLFKKTQSK